MNSFLLLLTCLLGSIGLVLGLDVIYGDSVDFPETANCTKPGAELWFQNQLVARWDGEEEWRVEPGFVTKIRPGKSVTLKEATMNDNGLFVLVCPGEEEKLIQLNVAAAREVSVAAGDELSFSFMCITSGATGEFRLERKGEDEPVLKLNFASGTVSIRPDFEDRLSLPSNWKTHGDLTVTMRQVTEKDEGDFFLYVNGRDGGKKQLSAWRVEVTNPGTTTITPPTPTQGPTGGNLETGTAVVIGLVIGLLCGAVIGGLFCDRRLKSLKSKLSRREAQNDEEQGPAGVEARDNVEQGPDHDEAPVDEEQGPGGEAEEDLPLQNMHRGRPFSFECNGNLGGSKGKCSVSRNGVGGGQTAGHPLIGGTGVAPVGDGGVATPPLLQPDDFIPPTFS